MFQKIEAIGRRTVDRLLSKRQENERTVSERTNTFFDFMRASGINVDKLSQEVVAEWFGNLTRAGFKVAEQSLDLITRLHSAYIWSNTQIQFEYLVNDEERRQLVTHVKQDVTTAPRDWGDLPINLSGVIAGISQIVSAKNQDGSPIISFRDDNGLGFDLLPRVGGIVFNFIGDQPRT